MENHGNLGNAAIVGGKGANVPGLPLHNGIESITEEQEEEKDGFVELITERQRSRLVIRCCCCRNVALNTESEYGCVAGIVYMFVPVWGTP